MLTATPRPNEGSKRIVPIGLHLGFYVPGASISRRHIAICTPIGIQMVIHS
jgi:hypothetical protein